MEPPEPITYRVLQAGDAHGLLALLRRIRPSLYGVTDDRAYRTAIDDGLKHGLPLLVVAVFRGEVVGYSIIAWGWTSFRLAFLLRHPLLALAVIRSRWSRLIRRRSRAHHLRLIADDPSRAESLALASGATPRWRDPTPGVARVLHTAVSPELRARGIGTGIKTFYVDVLRARGFRRVQAHVEAGNAASLALQRRSGWSLLQDDTGVIAYLDLGHDEGASG